VTQDPRSEVLDPVEGVDQEPLLVARDGVDREIAPLEVLLQRHVGRGVELEAVIAAGGFALGARERVLFVGVGMQKNGKVAADRAEPELDHVLRRRADDDVIAVFYRKAEKLVTHGPADLVDLHRVR
jgi:hypothetical protein